MNISIKQEASMKKLVGTMKAMADEPRMSILVVLALRGAVCVSHLQEAMRVPQPTVSRYLAILRNAGLLDAERRGQWVYYKLNEEDNGIALDVIRKSAEQLGQTSRIRKVMERLDKIEQQPPLDEQMSETSSRSIKAEARPATRARKHTVSQVARKKAAPKTAEEAPKASEGLASIENAVTPVQAYGNKGTAAEDIVAINFQQEEALLNETKEIAAKEAESDHALKAEDEKEKKGRKREKKPQPPSLFDI